MSKKKKLKRIMELCNYSILGVNEIDSYFAFKNRKMSFVNLHECINNLYIKSAVEKLDEQILGKSPLIGFVEATNNLKLAKEAFAKSQDERSRAILNAIDSIKNLVNIINELKKKKAMKITAEDIKIKDLIPEGYEIDDTKHWIFESSPECQLHIPAKKKEVKDFKWYAHKYFNKINKQFNIELVIDSNFEEAVFPFEFKIGLLKFICDDIGTRIGLVNPNDIYIDSKDVKKVDKLHSICPAEFLNSIFK